MCSRAVRSPENSCLIFFFFLQSNLIRNMNFQRDQIGLDVVNICVCKQGNPVVFVFMFQLQRNRLLSAITYF